MAARDPELWRKHVAEWKPSGQTEGAFAARSGLRHGRLSDWK